MVRSITHNIGSTSHNSTQSYHIVARPSGVKVPFAGRQPATVGGMEDFRKIFHGRFCAYQQNPKLCVVQAIKLYLQVTQAWQK